MHINIRSRVRAASTSLSLPSLVAKVLVLLRRLVIRSSPLRKTTPSCSLSPSKVLCPFEHLCIGTWTEKVVAAEECVLPVPQGLAPETASVLINTAGIAYRLLNDFTTLRSGDFIIQNAATSPVGLAVAQLAKARGIKTINIVCE